MSLAAPHYLWLLLMVPLLWLYARKRRKDEAVVYSSLDLLGERNVTWRQRLLFLLPLCFYLAIVCLVICLARPQTESLGTREDREGIAIQLVVDVSSSMSQDMKTEARARMTRMEVAKQVMVEFVKGDGEGLRGRPDDMIGVISFSRYSDNICPMTLGHDAVEYLIDEISINTRPNEDGTAYGDAVALAAARLKDQENTEDALKSKVILLLTDGENNCGEQMPLYAAAMAKEWGIKIYTISIQDQLEPKVVKTEGGTFLKPEVQSASDEVLEKMAESTGGIFRRAHDLNSLQSVYSEINALEKTRVREVGYTEYEERFVIFVIGALALLLIRAVLGSTVLRVSS